jgi:hypothetical protein
MRLRNQPNQCRLRVEELERRETPSNMGGTSLMTAGPPALAPPLGGREQPIPSVIGTFEAVVSVPGMSPIVVPVTITEQTGASFSTTIDANGLQVNLKGELNPAKDTVHFRVTIFSHGEKVGTGSGEGTFVDTETPTGSQVQSFDVAFTFQMTDGTTGSGTATLFRSDGGGGT